MAGTSAPVVSVGSELAWMSQVSSAYSGVASFTLERCGDLSGQAGVGADQVQVHLQAGAAGVNPKIVEQGRGDGFPSHILLLQSEQALAEHTRVQGRVKLRVEGDRVSDHDAAIVHLGIDDSRGRF